jgi:hypothetical protein
LSASIHFLTQSFCSFLSTWPNHFDLLYLTMAPISLTHLFSQLGSRFCVIQQRSTHLSD